MFAQTNAGTITGTISDPAGAVVASAAIEARNTETGATYPVASSTTGNYTLNQLPAGTYELTVTVAGFKKYIRPGLIVHDLIYFSGPAGIWKSSVFILLL